MPTVAKIALLEQFELFSALTNEEKIQLCEAMEHRKKPRYSVIYQPGDASDHIFLLTQGAVKISTHNSEGKEVIKQLIHPEAIFGELALVGETQRTETAHSLKEEVHFYTIRVSDFQRILAKSPALSLSLLQLFGQRMMAAEHKLENLIFKDARSRIVGFLYEVVAERGRRVGFEMLLKHSLTHQDIANITCTSRQTVTLVLNELRKENLIYFNRGRILVRDMETLQASAA
ncbi:Crp/Fnr family transcriptional regulator [Neolewinella lacunae]|uniref:Crp/Fnr family transcriptional regulator n=1 Tax=Neolewinella lacunae TaxID=1517758 RepID=A0A923PMF3_9BACT|nr:Crp/Fnr family transcriptional regulator [Neolewinella lacunae]MBC6993217.1 Crp/Fnr family transcriptional regulator [Neolewinella lacunae]MDN3635736.1 Crp/Fnr family transcriptional regulator [Neolewinella lacunae]